MRRAKTLGAATALACMLAAGGAVALPEPGQVTEARLDNGLRVLVWPDHDIPNVAMYLWFRVGSRNEAPGITGVSHFFEHMMFNGAKKYGPGEFDRVMEAKGGANNAFTSNDVTVYQNWFPKDAMPLIFELEADRVGHLKIDPKMVESERGVVYSERRTSVDDVNENVLDEQVRATAFVAHPYQIPVIGWPSDIESWSIEDLRSHFTTYYAPNNATLVVVGDVEPREVIALAKKTLGRIRAQEPPKPVTTKEPAQQGQRRLTVARPAQLPIVEVAFHALAPQDPLFPALELLEAVLLDGDSSRLHKRLVEQDRVALGVSGMLDDGFDPGLFAIGATVRDGISPAQVEAVLFEELARVAKEGVTADELAKAKRQKVAGFWRALTTINGKAYVLGHYDTFRGGWAGLFSAPKQVEAVTLLDVQRVASAVLRPEASTVGTLVPTDGEEASDAE
jgi:zinc protease